MVAWSESTVAGMADEVLRRVSFAEGTTETSDSATARSPPSATSGTAPMTSSTISPVTSCCRQPSSRAHLDKAFLAERRANPSGDLPRAIAAMLAAEALLDVDDIIEPAERAARLMARNGFHAVRTHADTTLENGLRSVEALAEVRRRVADVIDVEIVALCSWPITGTAGADQRALLRYALGAGADLVGGCPHLEGGRRGAIDIPRHRRRPRRGSRLAHRRDARRERRRARRSRRLRDGERVRVGSDGEPLRQPRNAVARTTAGDRRGRRRRRHHRRCAAGDEPLPPRARPSAGDTPWAHRRACAARCRRRPLAGGDNLQDPFNPLGRGCPSRRPR